MRIYLHIGTHKTGTTSLQFAFTQNRDALAAAGLLYPISGRPAKADGQGIWPQHNSLAWAFTRPEDEPPDFWLRLRTELDEATQDIAVLSSETLSLLRDPEHLSGLRAQLNPHEVKVVVYLRRQDELLHALYSTHVMQYLEARDIDSFRRALPEQRGHELDYELMLSRWEDAFGREAMIVRPYERSQLLHGDLVQDFAAQIGFELPEELAEPDENDLVNRSFPKNVLDFMLRLQRAGESKYELGQLRSLFAHVYRGRRTDSDILSPSQRFLLLEEYEASNRAVATKYLGRSDGHLFEDLSTGDQVAWEKRYEREFSDLTATVRDFGEALADALPQEARAQSSSATRGASRSNSQRPSAATAISTSSG